MVPHTLKTQTRPKILQHPARPGPYMASDFPHTTLTLAHRIVTFMALFLLLRYKKFIPIGGIHLMLRTPEFLCPSGTICT